MSSNLADVIDALRAAYPPDTAQSWDAVGLVTGDPAQRVDRVVISVDIDQSIVAEAIEHDAQLIVTHHPLLLRGVRSVATDTAKGKIIHQLIQSGIALYTAHTNADAANPGVSDALATALGLRITGPLAPTPAAALDVLSTTVPVADAGQVLAALHKAGAGRIGNYQQAAWQVNGLGQYQPLPTANPAIGTPGELVQLAETKIEVILDRGSRQAVLAALRAAHPYEETPFTITEMADIPSRYGIGRIGELLNPESLHTFTHRVANALPATTWGVRAAGDPHKLIRSVAICGGSGDSYLSAATAAGVDAYVTADLRHHVVSEHLAGGGPALIDVAHWASEWPWCAQAGEVIRSAFGGTVEVRVSTRRTDPWTLGVTQ